MAPVRFNTPSRISINPTENSMVRPTRTGMAIPKRIMAAPTATMVMVWPQPQRMPMSAAFGMERSRLTIVETAMTWSGSVAWRMPSRNPMVKMARPLVIVFMALFYAALLYDGLTLPHAKMLLDAPVSKHSLDALLRRKRSTDRVGGRRGGCALVQRRRGGGVLRGGRRDRRGEECLTALLLLLSSSRVRFPIA